MTNEQAVEILKNTTLQFGRANGKTAYIEALNMAIKALEKQARLEELMNMGAEVADRMFDEGNADDET